MKLFCYLLLILTTASIAANAGLLGTATFNVSGSTSPAVAHETRFVFTFGSSGYPFDPALFDNLVLTESSVGQVHVASSGSDPDFSGIAATMSDGVQDVLSFKATLGTGSLGSATSEKNWFSLGGDDFAGSTINAISFTVDALNFETVVDTTFIQARYTVRVYEDYPLSVQASTWGGIKALYR